MTWRGLFYFFFGCFLGGYAAWANAGYALVNPPAGLSFDPNTGYNWKPSLSTPPANGSWSAPGVLKYGGKNFEVPASWRVAANAGTFAKNALRFNPWLFVGTAAMSIAIDAGFEFIDGQWMYNDVPEQTYEPAAGTWRHNQGGLYIVGALDYVKSQLDAHAATLGLVPHVAWHNGDWYQSGGPNFGELNWVRRFTYPGCPHGLACPTEYMPSIAKISWNCPAGYVEQGGVCIPLPQLRPATEEDWSFPVGPLTDTQLDELSRLAPGGLPVTNPELEPVVAPLGEPYTDPVTGEQWRDMVRITPDPTPSSPLRVRVDPFREPMTTPDPTPENPNPVPEPDPTRPNETLPEMWPLFCEWAGPVCDFVDWVREPFSPPEDTEVPYLETPDFNSSPLSLPSSGSCPSPYSLSVGLGNVTLSYQPMCDLAVAVRPLVLAAAFLFAAFIVVGVRS